MPLHLKKRIQQHAWAKLTEVEAREHTLKYLFWEATLLCNLACRHCGSDCTRSHDTADELTTDEIKNLLRKVAAWQDPRRVMLAITGGEPLLRKDLFDVMGYAASLGFPWGMVTNGLAVDERVVEECRKAGMKTLTISLDGPARLHDWMRGRRGAFAKAVRAVELFRDARFVRKLEVTSVVAPRSIDRLPETLELISDLGVKRWRLLGVFPGGRAGAKHGRDLLMNSEDFVRLFQFIARTRRRVKIPRVYYGEEGYFGLRWEKEIRKHFHYCLAGMVVGGILANGDIMACPSIPREFVQGNIRRDDFIDVWNNRFREFRDREWMRKGPCRDCSLFDYCRGGGLHLWDSDRGCTRVCHHGLVKAYEQGAIKDMLDRGAP
ncbi:MAG: radical SAM protein [Pseudomonadota bacterium]